MKTSITRKKFYNKWLYKVSLEVSAAPIFRMYPLQHIKKYITNTPTERGDPDSIWTRVLADGKILLELVDLLMSLDKTTWSRRIEDRVIDFYTNDVGLYDTLSTNFEQLVIARSEPDTTSLELLEKPYTVLAKKLPHNKYKHRVYLLPHRLTSDITIRQNYVKWLDTQSPRISCTSSVREWIIHTKWNWDRRYVLVEDEQTLLMLKLRNSTIVGSVYNYVISDK